ncbi:MAG: ABC transporter permease [Solirubrobacterales bacterium]|nr:ABC transporter permease [Solirubrobacterales bacterium]MBV9717521.1 ABC transporter permease [Solirubrobacterales bacterium]
MAAPTEVAVPGGLEPVVVGPEVAVGRFRRLRAAGSIWVPAGLVLLIFALCFVWPLIGPVPPPTGGSILNSNLPSFSPGHLFGTDATGNDEWSRLLYGGRASLEVALGVNAIGLIVGGLLGAFAGYVGGWRDSVIMRVLDVLIAFPSLVLAVAIAERLGPGELHAIWALSFFSVPAFARIARAATLRVREQNYIVAAQLSGTGHLRTLLRHVSPNIIPQLTTFALLGMGITVVLEGALSFLGLGIPPPAPSWGNMIAAGQGVLSSQPKFVLLPSAALFITVIAFNLLGEGLRARWGER